MEPYLCPEHGEEVLSPLQNHTLCSAIDLKLGMILENFQKLQSQSRDLNFLDVAVF